MDKTICSVPDMRGITQTAERFGLPVHFVRQLVLTGKVISVRAGAKKYYVNQQSMIDYLNGVSR